MKEDFKISRVVYFSNRRSDLIQILDLTFSEKRIQIIEIKMTLNGRWNQILKVEIWNLSFDDHTKVFVLFFSFIKISAMNVTWIDHKDNAYLVLRLF